eukprot:3939277-Pleurochrysis_carterae.AAC.1
MDSATCLKGTPLYPSCAVESQTNARSTVCVCRGDTAYWCGVARHSAASECRVRAESACSLARRCT